jgi:Family of unknown function (DUF6060)
MSSSPFYCQSGVSSALQPCCISTLVEANTYQCNFANGDGIKSCLSAVTAATNGTLNIACSSQGGSANFAASSKKTSWSVKALALLFIMSLFGLVSASPTTPSPHQIGGAPFARREVDLLKRDNVKCTGFNIESQNTSASASVKISSTFDCQNSGGPCTFPADNQHSASHSSSYLLSDGSDVSGVTAATFGMDYTDSGTSVPQEGYSVPVPQEGYLTAYSQATLFRGTFTGCDGGDKPGEALVLKKNGVLYRVVVTNA